MKVLALTVLMSFACGGPAPAPDGPRVARSVDDAAGGGDSAPVAPEPAASDDSSAVAQLVLDAPDLQQYYHVDSVPDRSPLAVALNAHADAGWKLVKFGKPVQLIAPSALGQRPHVEFTRFEVSGDKARVELAYDVEGVVMSAQLERRGGSWVLVAADVAER